MIRRSIQAEDISEMTARDNTLLNLILQTGDSVEKVDLAKDLSIDKGDISKSFLDQAGKFAWWSIQAIKARSLINKKKLIVDTKEDYIKKTLKAQLYTRAREELEINGEKITESKIESYIYTSDSYLTAIKELNELKDELADMESTAKTLEMARDAFIQRKDMLISLGAQIRADKNNFGDISIKE